MNFGIQTYLLSFTFLSHCWIHKRPQKKTPKLGALVRTYTQITGKRQFPADGQVLPHVLWLMSLVMFILDTSHEFFNNILQGEIHIAALQFAIQGKFEEAWRGFKRPLLR